MTITLEYFICEPEEATDAQGQGIRLKPEPSLWPGSGSNSCSSLNFCLIIHTYFNTSKNVQKSYVLRSQRWIWLREKNSWSWSRPKTGRPQNPGVMYSTEITQQLKNWVYFGRRVGRPKACPHRPTLGSLPYPRRQCCRIQDVKKSLRSRSSVNFDTDMDPGKNYTDPDPAKRPRYQENLQKVYEKRS